MKRLFVLCAFLVFGFLFFSNSRLSFAADSQAFPIPTQAVEGQGIPNDIGLLTKGVLMESLSFAACQMTGVGFTPASATCGSRDGNSGGLLGFLSSGVMLTYNMPTSTAESIAYFKNNFGIVSPAYAQQGLGFEGLSAFQKIWVAFRDITYALFIFVFLFIGIGVMLRLNRDPRTVMTVQNQLPKVVIVLILITLSYAISGFLIDMMWVVVYLVLSIFHGIDQGGVANFSEELLRTPFGYANNSIFVGLPDIIPGAGEVDDVPVGFLYIPIKVAWSAGQIISVGGIQNLVVSHDLIKFPIVLAGMFHPLGWACFLNGINFDVGNIIGLNNPVTFPDVDYLARCVTLPQSGFFGLLGGIIVFFAVLIILLVTLFRLWVALIKAYVSIIVGTIFAPFWIALGLIPNSSQGIGSWIKFMVGNLAAFPLVIFMFALARYVLRNTDVSEGNVFVPPLIGNPGNAGILGPLIALGILLMTPSAVKSLKEAIGAGGAGGGLGESISKGFGIASIPGRRVGSMLFARDQHGHPRGPGARAFHRGRTATGKAFQDSSVGKPIADRYQRFRKWTTGTTSEEDEQARLAAEKARQNEPPHGGGVPIPDNNDGDDGSDDDDNSGGPQGTPPNTPPSGSFASSLGMVDKFGNPIAPNIPHGNIDTATDATSDDTSSQEEEKKKDEGGNKPEDEKLQQIEDEAYRAGKHLADIKRREGADNDEIQRAGMEEMNRTRRRLYGSLLRRDPELLMKNKAYGPVNTFLKEENAQDEKKNVS